MGGKSRIITFDIMKGAGILLMIIGHYELLPVAARTWIFSFHMPLFFLISGFFFKPNLDYKYVFIKNTRQLLRPYLLTAFLIVFFSLLSSLKNSAPSLLYHQSIALLFPTGIYPDWMTYHFGWTGGIGPIWFLLALFWCRIIANYLVNSGLPLWAIILISITAAFTDRYLINLPFAFLHGISAIVFYLIGYMIAKETLAWYYVAICFVCWLVACLYSHLDMYRCIYRFYPIDILGACGGTFFIYYVSVGLSRFRLTSPLKIILAWIGRASLAIVCFHTLLQLYQPLRILHINDAWYLTIPFNVITPVILAYLCSKFKATRELFAMV